MKRWSIRYTSSVRIRDYWLPVLDPMTQQVKYFDSFEAAKSYAELSFPSGNYRLIGGKES